MDLDEQLQLLAEEAPKYGLSSQVMEKAVNPVLKLFAQRLQHLEYYILQNVEEKWVLKVVSNRAKPEEQKHAIYAFPTFNDAGNFQGRKDPQIIALPTPVTHILFQIFAVQLADSIIFLETPGNFNLGTEIRRPDLHNAIQLQLQQLGNISPNPSPGNMPPNIA
ncbi:MAG: hypothetical protein DSM107014_09305 [Gomphosphaeria aponina SAG 52.96 = DSM 107014]|uniref:Uncharacterized protein n=1 Tax=Gomphosphaeria aponina SAG 52.96 = DSM 107014 TaxID=1521640 RepID=A0A941GWN2_9CHRO|nr:hypothetical protein [Gomphosphaeria aponina SAG 52.96 = DSM 107014]